MESIIAGTQGLMIRSTNLAYSSSYLGSQGHRNINLVMINEEPSFPECPLASVAFLRLRKNNCNYKRFLYNSGFKMLHKEINNRLLRWISEGHKIKREGPSDWKRKEDSRV